MKAQLKSMGLSLDWSRELASCDPSYYRHQQKMFLDFWKAGLAYRKEAWVNWDPVDNTVLANEQVIEGKGWRTGAPVERRKLTQWNLKITHFADELLERLDTLDRWPEKVRLMQANWIGKSRGARVFWQLTDASGADRGKLEIFTTRPDTLYGASFAALSAEHPLVAELAEKDPGPAALHRRMPQDRHGGGRDRDRREDRLQAAAARQASADAGQDPAGLCRQLRADGVRHRRDLRLSGPRRARPRVRDQVRPADHPGGDARGRRCEKLQRRGRAVRRGRRDHQLRFPERPHRRGRQDQGHRAAGGDGRRQGHDAVPPARLAGVAPALLGLRRSRPSIARSAAWCRCRRRTCRSSCPRMSSSTVRAIRSTAIRPGSTSPARTCGGAGAARDRHVRHLHRFRAGTSTGSPRRGSRRRRSIARRTTTGCRSTSISAASSTRSCTCSIRASGPAPCARCR